MSKRVVVLYGRLFNIAGNGFAHVVRAV